MVSPIQEPFDAKQRDETLVHKPTGPEEPVRVSNLSNSWGINGLAFGVAPFLLICGGVFAWELTYSADAVRFGGGAERFIFPCMLLGLLSALELVALRLAARETLAIEFSQVITLIFPFHRKIYQWEDLRRIKGTPIGSSLILRLVLVWIDFRRRDLINVELVFSDERKWDCRMKLATCEAVFGPRFVESHSLLRGRSWEMTI